MSQPVQTRINPIQLYRPLCSKCGTLTQLARIEPSGDPDHDLRTFECNVRQQRCREDQVQVVTPLA